MSALLVVLLGASPLVGPVCGLLCGHPVESVGHAHQAAHGHGMHAGHDASSEPASAEDRVSDVTAMSSDESCCAFDVASSVLAATARLQLHSPSPRDAASAARVTAGHGLTRHRAPPPSVPLRRDVSSARLPLVLRI
jgi:hypothetical protein